MRSKLSPRPYVRKRQSRSAENCVGYIRPDSQGGPAIDSLSWTEEALRLGAALAAGLLLGIERGWTLRGQVGGSRVAGFRTFALVGLSGGIAGLLAERGAALAGGAIAASMAILLAFSYAPTLRRRKDATTAVAALLTLGTGFLSGSGSEGLAIASAAVAVLILALRTELHGFLKKLDQRDIKALARFAIIALAVFPFLPNRALGPYDAWNPAKLWWVVVLVTGFSFAGYIANRVFGVRHGTIATAVIGGAYSSTAVTQSLSQRLQLAEEKGAAQAGIALASAVMYLRVILLVGALATRMLVPLIMAVAPALVVAWIVGVRLLRRAPHSEGPMPRSNPIELVPAFGFLIFVALAALAARWAEGQFGQSGIAALLLITGSMDVDSAVVTAGGLPTTAIAAPLAALAIGGTIVANMLVKIGVTVFYARRAGRAAAMALAASTFTLIATLVAILLR